MSKLDKRIIDEYVNNGIILIEEEVNFKGKKYKEIFNVDESEEELYQEYFKWYTDTYSHEDYVCTPDSTYHNINGVAELIHMRREWEIVAEIGYFHSGYKLSDKRLEELREQTFMFGVQTFKEWKKHIKNI